MKLKYTFAINEVAGQMIAVPVDCEYGQQSIIKTNDTGAYILNLLKTDISLDEILKDIKNNFEIDDETELKNWICEFLKNLENAGVLVNE